MGFKCSPAPWQQLLLLWQQPVRRLAKLFPASSFFSFHAWPGCFQLQSFFLLISRSNVRHEMGFKCSPAPWQQLLLPWQQPVGRLFTPGQAVSSFKTFFFLFQKATSGTKWASNVPRRPGSRFLLPWQQPVGRLARLFPALSLFSSHFRKQRQARNGLQMFPGALAAASVALAAACWAPCQAVPSFKPFFFSFQKATSGTKWASNVPRRPGSSFCCFGNSLFGALPGCSQL